MPRAPPKLLRRGDGLIVTTARRLFREGLLVDAAHIRWHAHGGPDEVPNGLALCALHHRLFDHGAITVREDLTGAGRAGPGGKLGA